MAQPDSPELILVVDDSPVVRHVVRIALEAQGHQVVEAGDGLAAIESATDQRPNVILLDVEMPRLDGLSTLDRLREMPELAGVPVILLTGHSDSDQVIVGLGRGAHDYLTKPFEPAQLAARVGAALRTARLYDRLARRNRELDHFASKAAHDLKSPLAIIKGGADILQLGWDRFDADTRNGQLAAMARASMRTAAMVDDLLALARFDADEKGEAASTDVRTVINAVVEAARPHDDEKVTVSGRYARVVMPEADLAAALRNVVENARHYGRGEDGTLQLTITGTVEEGCQRIDIADAGPGVPDALRAKIFDAFHTAPESKDMNPASTGVGLSIVRRAVERWGGRTYLESPEPCGATFVLVIPTAEQG